SLNGLLERLRRAFATQRAFVADAAHELRTPIAALKLQAGLVARARDDAARGEALRDLMAGIVRAAHLGDEPLTLARAEPHARAAAGPTLGLARAAGEAVAATLPLAQAHGSQVLLDAPRPAELQGDAS